VVGIVAIGVVVAADVVVGVMWTVARVVEGLSFRVGCNNDPTALLQATVEC
jgi:hypothetical protein